MIRTYEAWGEPDQDSVALVLADEVAGMRLKGLLSQEAKLLYRIDALTHEEALAIHHLRMGWEPYQPLGPASPCPQCGAQLYSKGSGQCWRCGTTV